MHENLASSTSFRLVVLANVALRGGYGLMRFAWPEHETKLDPGHSLQLHLEDTQADVCAPLFRTDSRGEWCEVLYWQCKELSQRQPNESIICRGVTGTELTSAFAAPTILLLGSGIGLAPIVFCADQLRQRRQQGRSIALLEFENETPFIAKPSHILLPVVPHGVIACMPLLEDWGIASRLASTTDQPGAFDGDLIALTDSVLTRIVSKESGQVALVAAGANGFIERLLALREKYQIQPELAPMCPLADAVASR